MVISIILLPWAMPRLRLTARAAMQYGTGQDIERTILDHEKAVARQLAIMVIDKPAPPFWMTFVPMFLVFFTQKLKEYASSVDTFVDSYLVSRCDALKAARGNQSDLNRTHLLRESGKMPPTAQEAYERCMTLLAGHYCRLLQCPGGDIRDLVRNAYSSKENYAQFCDELNKAEIELNTALIPEIDEDAACLMSVVETMNASIIQLRRKETDAFFPGIP